MAVTNMYEWIDHEIEEVRTGKFFCIGVESPHDCVEGSTADINAGPASYREFVRKFGQVRLFRDDTGCYEIGVFDNPLQREIDGGRYWEVGWYDERTALLMTTSAPNVEWPAFEESKFGRLQRVAASFEEWLRLRWRDARARYSASQWKAIVEGPRPFSLEELQIVESRKRFRWRVLGVEADSSVRIEVSNGSTQYLPFLSIGVHGTQRDVWFAIALPVDHIAPGKRDVVTYDKFPRGWLDPNEIELYDRPDPGPEDRRFYSEFRTS